MVIVNVCRLAISNSTFHMWMTKEEEIKLDLKLYYPDLKRTKTEIYEIVSDITSGVHLGATDNLTKRTTEKRHVIRKLPFGYTQEIYLASFHLLKTQRGRSLLKFKS